MKYAILNSCLFLLTSYPAMALPSVSDVSSQEKFGIYAENGEPIVISKSVECVASSFDGKKMNFNMIFDNKGKADFSDYTSSNKDKKIRFIVNGEIVAEPIIVSAITSGKISFNVNTLEQEKLSTKAFADFKKCTSKDLGR